jgi:hypothetical protein
LAAEDEPALSAWLVANGYLSTPEVKAWLKPYIAAKWKITAFKLIKATNSPVLTTSAIRLSFRTDQAFYPYSEPSDRQRASAVGPLGRELQVSILSNERMTGILANKARWPGKLEFAGSSAPQDWLTLAGLDNAGYKMSLPTKLTTFIDESNPRPGTADIYFSPDSDQGSFQGETVNLNLPTQNRLFFGHSFKDAAALLTLIICRLFHFIAAGRF